MKLVVLGANGGTGKHVLRAALDDGMTVTAVVRSETKLPKIQHPNLKTVVGDPCDPMFLKTVLRDLRCSSRSRRCWEHSCDTSFPHAERMEHVLKNRPTAARVVSLLRMPLGPDLDPDRGLLAQVRRSCRSAPRPRAVEASRPRRAPAGTSRAETGRRPAPSRRRAATGSARSPALRPSSLAGGDRHLGMKRVPVTEAVPLRDPLQRLCVADRLALFGEGARRLLCFLLLASEIVGKSRVMPAPPEPW
jgi:hypothetical protein